MQHNFQAQQPGQYQVEPAQQAPVQQQQFYMPVPQGQVSEPAEEPPVHQQVHQPAPSAPIQAAPMQQPVPHSQAQAPAYQSLVQQPAPQCQPQAPTQHVPMQKPVPQQCQGQAPVNEPPVQQFYQPASAPQQCQAQAPAQESPLEQQFYKPAPQVPIQAQAQQAPMQQLYQPVPVPQQGYVQDPAQQMYHPVPQYPGQAPNRDATYSNSQGGNDFGICMSKCCFCIAHPTSAIGIAITDFLLAAVVIASAIIVWAADQFHHTWFWVWSVVCLANGGIFLISAVLSLFAGLIKERAAARMCAMLASTGHGLLTVSSLGGGILSVINILEEDIFDKGEWTVTVSVVAGISAHVIGVIVGVHFAIVMFGFSKYAKKNL